MAINRRALAAALGAASLIGMLPVTALAQKKLALGFAQIGSESEWRTANTESIKSSAKEAGIDLKFSGAQQKQAYQIKTMRSYIAQKGDVIASFPVVKTGWGTVPLKAKAAKILVVLTDRCIFLNDDSSCATFKGSDFIRARGKEMMEAFLKADDLAIGAIQAIEEARLNPAKDITITSIDGVKDAFDAMIAVQAERIGRVQSAARPAADECRDGRQGWQGFA